jgi:glycosyltransferase involved in cell wall biosynthesis
LIYDAEAVFAIRAQERARFQGDTDSNIAAREFMEELELAPKADDIICVSELERRYFVERGLGPVHVFGHGLRSKPTTTNFEARHDILFVGAMNSVESPNEDSVLWFCRQVLPLVRERLSEAIRLIVVGQNTIERLSVLVDDPSVEIVGSVEDLTSYYERARIFVAPTRFAAGIPIKILEAASRGVPIVATSLIAAQLGWIDGEQLLKAPADSPEEFAQQCVRLYGDKQLWLHLREEALRRSREDCSIDRFEQNLRGILAPCRPLAWAAEEDAMVVSYGSAGSRVSF